MYRRNFLAMMMPTLTISGFTDFFPFEFSPYGQDMAEIKEYLNKILYTKDEVEGWFAGKMFPFSKYHSEFGWLLNSQSFRDGIHDSWSVYTYRDPDGERIMLNYADKPCRINTYGNSFTQCHQVSDHETWQEVLAAHIREPVRNFGIGGWSVYQAYLRMLKEEQRTPSDLIIINIYSDDHYRNLDSWRNIRVRKHPQHIEATLPYLKVDVKKGRIVQCPNPCPTPEDYFKLCNSEETYQLFKDDFVLRIMIAHEKSAAGNPAKQFRELAELSRTHGIETRMDESETISAVAEKLHSEAALFSSCRLVSMIEEFASKQHKKVLYVLSYPASYIAGHQKNGIRWDQKFIDFLKTSNLNYVDLSEKHLKDFSDYKTGIEWYLSKYFIGHYNPAGNFFCADSLLEKVVEILDPKPLPYLKNG